MKTAYFNLFTIACLLLLLIACESDCQKKGNCPPEYYRFELGEAKNYLWASKGSYWIYRNTKTGDLDTQTVTTCKTYWVSDRGTTKYTKHISVDYEVLVRLLKSTFNGWEYKDKTSFYNADALRPFKTYLVRTISNSGQSINDPFWMPAFKNENGGATNCVNVDTTITIGSKVYEHVVVFDIDIDAIWENKLGCIRPNSRYYWVKDIGLVKKEMNRCNYSWELIDYKILQ